MDLTNTQTFYLVPQEVLDELIEAIRDLKKLQLGLENKDISQALGDYISEEIARDLLARGKTWFHNKRKSQELPGKKAAGRWYYKRQDLLKLIESGKNINES